MPGKKGYRWPDTIFSKGVTYGKICGVEDMRKSILKVLGLDTLIHLIKSDVKPHRKYNKEQKERWSQGYELGYRMGKKSVHSSLVDIFEQCE